jgi:hypothetical protein
VSKRLLDDVAKALRVLVAEAASAESHIIETLGC